MVTGAQPAQNLMNSCSSALSLSDMEDRFKKYSEADEEVPIINDDPTLYELNMDDHDNLEIYEKKVNPFDNMAQS